MKDTLLPYPLDALPTLDPQAFSRESRRAAAQFVADGTPANTARSYASALRYWAAWLQGRYALPLGDAPLPVVAQFILDHLPSRTKTGLQHELTPALHAALRAVGAKRKAVSLAYNTVARRLAVLAQWHKLRHWTAATDSAAVREPLEAMLATCTDGLRGTRDRVLLLLAWSGGGRRRSEVVDLQVEDLRRLDDTTWLYALGTTKTDDSAVRREKSLRGPAVVALQGWLTAAKLTEGPLFRRLQRGGHVGAHAITGVETVCAPASSPKPGAKGCPWAR